MICCKAGFRKHLAGDSAEGHGGGHPISSQTLITRGHGRDVNYEMSTSAVSTSRICICRLYIYIHLYMYTKNIYIHYIWWLCWKMLFLFIFDEPWCIIGVMSFFLGGIYALLIPPGIQFIVCAQSSFSIPAGTSSAGHRISKISKSNLSN